MTLEQGRRRKLFLVKIVVVLAAPGSVPRVVRTTIGLRLKMRNSRKDLKVLNSLNSKHNKVAEAAAPEQVMHLKISCRCWTRNYLIN